MRSHRAVLAALLVACLAAAVSLVLYSRLTGVVAVIKVSGYILTAEDADYYTSLIHSAYRDDSVKAVVLVVDSFGGSADYVEQVYYNLRQLKSRKPVVAVAVNALSGGYYICAAADYIFAHPTSLVGSIGVIATAPPILVPSEGVLETGPYKLTAFSRLNFFSNLSRALDAFISAVQEGRGDRLKAPREELSKALVYLGSEALKLGLVDQLGSTQQAVEEAAKRAGLLSYTVRELERGNATPGSLYSWRNVTASLLESLHPPPTVYYVYLPSSQISERAAAPVQPTGSGRVVVDLSHGNRVSWWSLDALIGELARLNVTVGFVDAWDRVRRELGNASAFIVAAPTRPYTSEELRDIEDFVNKGGVLLLLFDPAYEYIGYEGITSFITAPINTLASRFGITFAYGYLYNPNDNFGFYRNVYVRRFANSSIFQGVREIVLFTAAAVRSDYAVAWAPEGTVLSVSERAGEYAVAALHKWGNGTVLALGDITLFTEPYCHVADNELFIRNLARLIANATPARVKVETEPKLEKPQLPVGTVKVFEVRENGDVYAMTWRRTAEDEVVVETPYYAAKYYYVGERLKGWEADGVKCVYDEPLPEPPFPLTRGSSWNYSTGYSLYIEGVEYRGSLEGREYVEGFEKVTALDGHTYFCASIRFELIERFSGGGVTVVTVTRGYYWVSYEAGLVKQSTSVRREYNQASSVISREIVMRSLSKPEQ